MKEVYGIYTVIFKYYAGSRFSMNHGVRRFGSNQTGGGHAGRLSTARAPCVTKGSESPCIGLNKGITCLYTTVRVPLGVTGADDAGTWMSASEQS